MLAVENVEKSFGDKRILKGVSFRVEKGEIFGLIGKNGAGKTTLINIMAGLSSADAGKCRINEKVITVANRPTNVGYLPDSPNFFEFLTCGEYLDFLLMEHQSPERKRILDLVELTPDIKIETMSRGMRQRLGIAAAIVGNPEVILLDEPTSALDPSGRADVARILSDLRNAGKTIILSTHILADMEKLCDQVGFLSEGTIKKSLHIDELDKGGSFISVSFRDNNLVLDQLKSEGASYEVQNNGNIRFSVVDDEDCTKQRELFSLLSRINSHIESIHSEVGTLDKIFQEVCG